MTVRTAVFPVGGLGTRFLPATKAIPKEMLPVVDRPLVEYAVDEAIASGIERFVFVTGHGKTAIEDHFDHHHELEAALTARGREDLLRSITADLLPPGSVAYVRQMQPLGLGHAVWCARHFVGDEPFAVLLPDDLVHGPAPCLADLVAVHARTGGSVLATMEVDPTETRRYGIVDPASTSDDGVVAVRDLVEKPDPAEAPSTTAIVGRYVLVPEVMAVLGDQERGAGGEIQLTDALRRLLGTSPIHAVPLRGRRYDCGTKLGFLEANVALALERDDLGDVTGVLRDLLDGTPT
ncbi:MAG TPA: UTP--glucose-1-phosphate uridylyltransferase GalU [Actinobacteria bacterium]|nr:UTP--glucose-1-phosphate uridylyltransferase GalU [Actinomycetota bacterium]